MCKEVVTKLDDARGNHIFYCPACKHMHPFATKKLEGFPDSPCWTFNGDMVKPTFSPSLRCMGGPTGTLCHLFVKNGKIEYCGDCPHEMAGTTVDMIPIEDT